MTVSRLYFSGTYHDRMSYAVFSTCQQASTVGTLLQTSRRSHHDHVVTFLDQIFQELSQLDLESAEVTVYVDKPESGLGVLVQDTAVQQLTVDYLNVHVESLDVQEAKPISVDGTPISAEFDIPSEVLSLIHI